MTLRLKQQSIKFSCPQYGSRFLEAEAQRIVNMDNKKKKRLIVRAHFHKQSILFLTRLLWVCQLKGSCSCDADALYFPIYSSTRYIANLNSLAHSLWYDSGCEGKSNITKLNDMNIHSVFGFGGRVLLNHGTQENMCIYIYIHIKYIHTYIIIWWIVFN